MKKQLPILREKVINNWLYKLVALAVAVAIWVTTLHGRKDSILVRNMDLEFLLKPNYVITNVEDRTVRVKLAGARTSLKKLSQTPQTITINLTNEEEGQKRVTLRPTDIPLPTGVKLISLSPNEIELIIKEVKKP
jgi:YbbR domain-containing protein